MYVHDAFVRSISEKGTGLFSLGVLQNRLFDTGGFLCMENPTLGVGFPFAYSYKYGRKTPFDLLRKACGLATASQTNQKEDTMGDTKSLAHTKWNCKYHIVFAPKYRRQVFYGEKKRVVGEILRKLCEWKGVNIVEAECCPDHIHMLLEIPPKMSVSSFMGYLKGKSSLMLYDQFGELKFKYRNREFWCRGYYVDTVGKNKVKIQEYIKHQLSEDKLGDQLSLPYPGSPFTGRK
jgi:putative transposase